ncbi:rare lipoprotein A [Bartonella silvatica]|uniref:Endolytic peptidoglycan transglycosylase RlpA n=1 Tax=Bartonella silvatica TaxID=357760 RepID=A0ABV2HIB2_9HYPH
MLLISTEKLICVFNSTLRFTFVVIFSQLLISCCASQTAHFKIKSFCNNNNKEANIKTTAFSKKELRGKHQPKKRGNGRAVVGKPYQIKGKWYYPQNDPNYKRVGEASWYGSDFHGRLTANGEIYDMNLLTAAHPTMPLPSYARVTNLKNGSSIVVRVNDRGPFMKDRIIDLSKQAAQILGYANAGVTSVKVEYISEAPVGYYDSAYLMASYTSGNNTSSPLILANILKEKEETAQESLYTSHQKQLVEATIGKKQLNKDFSVKLPEIGPILIDKPVLFDQVAFINMLSKKMQVN